MRRRQARRTLAAAALLGAAAAVVVIVAGHGRSAAERCGRGVDLSEWRPSVTDDRAAPTAGRIVACRFLDGRSRPEVRALLGSPTDHHAGSRAGSGPGSTWSYAVGQVGYAFSDEQDLLVEFDGAGRVHRTSLNR